MTLAYEAGQCLTLFRRSVFYWLLRSELCHAHALYVEPLEYKYIILMLHSLILCSEFWLCSFFFMGSLLPALCYCILLFTFWLFFTAAEAIKLCVFF